MICESIQLYSLRNLGDFGNIASACEQAGFSHVELIESQLLGPDTKAILADHGLKVSSSHLSLRALRENFPAVIDAAHALEIDTIVMPSLPPELRDGDAAFWRQLGRDLGSIAETAGRDGISVGYHNHFWELEKKDGGLTALDLLFAEGGPQGLGWQVDVAWLVRAKADLDAWLSRSDISYLSFHIKDMAPEGENPEEDGWATPGRGVMDWPALMPTLRRTSAALYVIEHDKPTDPLGFAIESRQILRDLLKV